MRSASRRSFLHRTVQVGTGAALSAVAGCLSSGSGGSNSSNNNNSGSGRSKKSEAIENVSFAGTEIRFELAEAAVGKTINLVPSGDEQPIRNSMIHGGNTSIGFSLVETTVQGKIPIPSGKYVIQVVEDTEVVSKRSVELMPDLKLENIDNNSAPPNSFKTNIKLRNDGTLPVHIDEINVSGVPEPASQNELSFNRPGSNSMKIRSTVGSNKTATFNLEGYPFALGTRQDMYNYTVGNSSSRKCPGKEQQATLAVNLSQGETLKIPFTYTLSGEARIVGNDFHCGNFSASFSGNKPKTAGENQTSNNLN